MKIKFFKYIKFKEMYNYNYNYDCGYNYGHYHKIDNRTNSDEYNYYNKTDDCNSSEFNYNTDEYNYSSAADELDELICEENNNYDHLDLDHNYDHYNYQNNDHEDYYEQDQQYNKYSDYDDDDEYSNYDHSNYYSSQGPEYSEYQEYPEYPEYANYECYDNVQSEYFQTPVMSNNNNDIGICLCKIRIELFDDRHCVEEQHENNYYC